MIMDPEGKAKQEVTDFLVDGGVIPNRNNAASPWQNGFAERWIPTCRRELLDHALVLNEAHLCRLIRDYISYYHVTMRIESPIRSKRTYRQGGSV